jgi:tetratricopeptide (TPR) repeat protein
MKTVHPSVLLPVLLGLGLAGPAHALSCDEIVAMVDVGVPTHIVVQTIEQGGGSYDATLLACLEHAAVPDEVMAAARARMSQPAPAAGLEPAPSPHQGKATPSEDDWTRRVAKLQRSGKHLTASLMLSDLLMEDRFPKRRGRHHVLLARSLAALDMPESARHHLLEAVRLGPSDPGFDGALAGLASLARQTGYEADLARVAARLSPTDWPRQAQPTLAYHLGLRRLEQGQLSDALSSLGLVPSDSPHGLQARYLEGVIQNRIGHPRAAVRAFQEVMRGQSAAHSRAEARRIQDLKNLALLDLARIHYGLELYQRAEELYSRVEPESRHWAQARLEMAWSQFMLSDTSGSLGQLLTVRSPYFADEPYLPEAEVLRALNYYTLCEYGEVERIALGFEARTRPVATELRGFAHSYASPQGRELADQAWSTYFESFPADSVLGPEIFTHMLRNRDLARELDRLERIDAELALIGAQKRQWSTVMEPRLLPSLEAERQRSRRRAGLLLLAEAAELAAELDELLIQSELIRFEANDALRGEIAALAEHPSQGLLMSLADAAIPYATNPDEVYWPFNGEFWEDELGSYLYVGETACR